MSSLLSASSAISRASSSDNTPSSRCQTRSPSPGFRMYSPVYGDHLSALNGGASLAPFSTPPALNGRAFGYVHASQRWRNGVDEARVDMLTSASQGGISASSSSDVGNYQAQLASVPDARHATVYRQPSFQGGLLSASSSSDVGNYQAQLDSVPGARHAAVHRQPRVYLNAPQLQFNTGVTSSASHPIQHRNFGSAFTNSGVVRPDQGLGKRPHTQPVVPLMHQQPSTEARPRTAGSVGPTTARVPPVSDHEDLDPSLQMEMDLIADIDNHTPHFGTPNPRVLLGKRTYGYGTTPKTSSSDAHDSMSSAKRFCQSSAKSPITVDDEVSSLCSRQPEPNCDSWASQSPSLTSAEEQGMSVTPEQEPPFTKSHRDWIMDGFPSRQPFCLSGILLDAFPQCWVALSDVRFSIRTKLRWPPSDGVTCCWMQLRLTSSVWLFACPRLLWELDKSSNGPYAQWSGRCLWMPHGTTSP